MPRRAGVQVRTLEPDAVYNSRLVAQIVNRVMVDGKKSTAERVVYKALDRVGERTGRPPVEVRPERQLALGMRWIISYSRNRGEKTMQDKLANEIIDAAQNKGNAVKKREDTHKMAEANKAFAHYRW